MKLSNLIPADENPRFIKDVKFLQLVENIKKYPKFLEKRPIVIESFHNPVIIGGNMRYRALAHLGYKEIPDEWVKSAEDFTAEERRAFTIIDNVPFGEWDYDKLANHYDYADLNNWGLDMPDFDSLSDINVDDFFKPAETEEISVNNTIILEYAAEDAQKVRAALARIASTPEEAVWQLLELGS